MFMFIDDEYVYGNEVNGYLFWFWWLLWFSFSFVVDILDDDFFVNVVVVVGFYGLLVRWCVMLGLLCWLLMEFVFNVELYLGEGVLGMGFCK